MMHTQHLVTLVTLFMLLTAGWAQEPPAPAAYDLPGVVARALEANPTIHAARHTVTAAVAKVEEARASRHVKVQAEAGYLQLAEDPSFSVPAMGGSMVFGDTSNPWLNVSLQWPIYTGGMIQGMLAASRQGVDAAWQGYARTRQEIAAEAAVAYFQVLSAQQMVAVLQGQVTTLQEAVRVATGLRAQGIVAKLDVLRPTADLATAQTALTQAENGVQLALANLRRIVNLSPESPLTLRPTAEPPLALPADLAPAVQTALAQRPEVKQLQAHLRATDGQWTIAHAGRRPQVGLQAQYDVERPTTYPDIGHWSVALVIRHSLSDGGTSRARMAAADAQREELRAREAALRQGITMQVTQAVLNLRAADKRVQSATTARATAEEAFAAAEVSYKNQVVPIIDVLGAQTALTAARVQLTLAEFDRQTARVQYRLALGEDV
jgi:outer membrane protein TolC